MSFILGYSSELRRIVRIFDKFSVIFFLNIFLRAWEQRDRHLATYVHILRMNIIRNGRGSLCRRNATQCQSAALWRAINSIMKKSMIDARDIPQRTLETKSPMLVMRKNFSALFMWTIKMRFSDKWPSFERIRTYMDKFFVESTMRDDSRWPMKAHNDKVTFWADFHDSSWHRWWPWWQWWGWWRQWPMTI